MSADDVDANDLSVRDLKEWLRDAGVDYSKCLEKSELGALARKTPRVEKPY
jgi:E3 ubiquitin-protein ligase rififylin-like domain